MIKRWLVNTGKIEHIWDHEPPHLESIAMVDEDTFNKFNIAHQHDIDLLNLEIKDLNLEIKFYERALEDKSNKIAKLTSELVLIKHADTFKKLADSGD